jgi:hypothetical protein
MRDDDNRLPIWLGGILLALILIFISTRGGVNNPELSQHFAPQPTDPHSPPAGPLQLPQIRLPDLPPDMQHALTSLRDRFAGGQGIPALTPVVSGPRIRLTVQEVKRTADRVRVTGSVENLSDTPLVIPTSAFSFRDSAGISYTTTGASPTLAPGQSTPLDLSVPLPPARGLTLIVTLPPDPPLEQVLVLETTS